MAESKTEVRFPKATATTPIDAAVVVSSMSMTLTVDTSPVVEFVTHPKVDARQQAIAMSNIEAAQLVGRGQQSIFTARETPDTTITVEDGAGGVLQFVGYYSNPSYAFGFGSAGMRQSAIHESAAMDSIAPEIYSATNGNGSKVNSEPLVATSLADRISQIQKLLVKTWEEGKITEDVSDKEALIRDQLHAINLKLLPLWYKVLENSAESMGWEEMENLSNPQKEDLNEMLGASLMQQTESFFGIMLRLNSMFQTVWIPDMTPGNIGKYVRRRTLFENPVDIKITPINSRFSGGSSRLMPITHCVVQMPGMITWKNTGEAEMLTPGPIVAGWPEVPYAGGRVIRDPGPPWLSSIDLGAAETALVNNRLDLGAYIAKRTETITDSLKDSVDTCLRIAQEWAKDVYNWAALSGAQASIDIPMDLTIRPGQYLNVTTKDGALFKGFVYSVRHDLVAGDSGSSGTATTNLNFTNVEATGFTLPGRK